MTETMGREAAAPRWSRAVEFAALYVGVPLALALAMPPSALLPMLFAVTALGAALLAPTPGFAWRELTRGWGRLDWRHVGLVTAVVTGGMVAWLTPSAALALPRRMPRL